jgi:hypothetical protein
VKLILLGPQRRPSVDGVLRSLRTDGPVVTVTAGWQERELDDHELGGLLGGRDMNLSLFRRWLDVAERDPVFAAAERRLRDVREQVHELYLLRLDHALGAVYAVERRGRDGRAQADALAEAIAAVRELDAQHLRRITDIHAEFWVTTEPHNRPVIAGHREAVAGQLREAAVVVIAGGHVGVLVDVLHLFGVGGLVRSPVIAWSAGAMALTEEIVLFHDRAPQGPGHPELYGRGLGLLRNLLPLPHARARLLLDDVPRMAVFARRFAPARCVLMDSGTRIDTDGDGRCPPGTRVLTGDGHVTSLEAP